MTKPAGTALAFGEFVDDLKVNLRHWHENHLRDAITYRNFKGRLTSVPKGDKHLALIVRVDQPDQIAKNDPMLVTET